MRRHIDYQSKFVYLVESDDPDEQPNDCRPLIALGCVVLGINVVLLILAASAPGKFATGIAILFGPAINLITIFPALAFAPSIRRQFGRGVGNSYALLAVVLPVMGILVDFLVILSMGWTGC
jgi:uncharacterized membrane protein YidH (DUF202 family)